MRSWLLLELAASPEQKPDRRPGAPATWSLIRESSRLYGAASHGKDERGLRRRLADIVLASGNVTWDYRSRLTVMARRRRSGSVSLQL